MSDTMQALFIANTGMHYISFYPNWTFFASSSDYSTHGHDNGTWRVELGKVWVAQETSTRWRIDVDEVQVAYQRYLARLVVSE